MMRLRNGLWAFIIPVCALIIAMIIPAYLKAGKISERVVCGVNLGSLSNAMLIYMGRNDGGYPSPTQWCDSLLQEPGGVTENVFRCGGIFGYAMNKAIFEIKPKQAPPNLVMLFEASLGRNGVGGMEEVVLRHSKDGYPGCNIGFADGHVEFVTKDQIAGLLWTIEKSKTKTGDK